jgi:mRNA interferase MazF
MTTELVEGAVVWVAFGESRGREQSGHRPAVIVASGEFLAVADTLAIVVPATTRDRGWINHIRLTGPSGLAVPSWAMVEQLRSISRERITRVVGGVDAACLALVRRSIRDFLDL